MSEDKEKSSYRENQKPLPLNTYIVVLGYTLASYVSNMKYKVIKLKGRDRLDALEKAKDDQQKWEKTKIVNFWLEKVISLEDFEEP